MEHGWDLKRLHRRIVLSQTYRMASVAGGAGLKTDPENRLLWHFPRRRLEGEAIRDFDASGKWQVTKDPAQHTRRSVYVLVRRTFLYPLFAAFDPPEVMTSCPRRRQTVVATQALALFNSPLAREQAAAFARRLRRECGDRPEAAVARAWELAFGRPPTSAERERALAFLQERSAGVGGRSGDRAPTEGDRAPTEGALADLCLALFNANEFLYVD